MKTKFNNCILFIALLCMAASCTKSGNNDGTGPGGGTKPKAPPAPVAQSANPAAVTAAGFTASWQKVAGADKYLLYVAADNQFQQPLNNYNPATVTDTSAAINNLNAATNYYYRVQASAAGVVGAYSNTVQVTTLAVKTNPTWKVVGSTGFSAGGVVYNTSLALDGNNTPYIAYQDAGNNNAATVMKFSNGNWTPVGSPGFSQPNIGLISLAIDKNSNTPYVVYGDSFGYTTVQKLVNNNWSIVGSQQFIPLVGQPSIAIDKTGTPYVAVIDYGDGDKSSVLKLVNNNWVYVGSEGFSLNALNTISLALDGNNAPYVGYDNGHGTVVQKFTGSGWSYIGATQFNGSTADFTTLAIDNNNNLFVGYALSYGLPHVMKFNGSYWAQVGADLTNSDYYPSFALDKSGTPYLVFQENSSAYHSVSVAKFDGSNWAALGNTSFSGGYIGALQSGTIPMPPNIVIDGNGVVYVAYADDNVNARATVMKFVQ